MGRRRGEGAKEESPGTKDGEPTRLAEGFCFAAASKGWGIIPSARLRARTGMIATDLCSPPVSVPDRVPSARAD